MSKMSNEYFKTYQDKRWNERKLNSIYYLGGVCNNCGSSENLEFDHIDPKTKLFTLSKVPFASEARWKAELDKCQLLCNKCHKNKSIAEGSFGNDDKEYACVCGKVIFSKKAYAGHKRWCKHK